MTLPITPHYSVPRTVALPQRGAALYVVLLLVMLATLAAAWGARTSLFNQLIVSNDADYQRAVEAAQAMIQDGELDIWMHLDNKKRCVMDGPSTENCGIVQFPQETQNLDAFIDDLAFVTCEYGICIKRAGSQDFWDDAADLASRTVTNVGARYGQFTGAVSDGNSSSATLAVTGDGATGAWYWIELMPYIDVAGGQLIVNSNDGNLLELNSITPAVVYRITAIAYGVKPGTRVVLQETYVDFRHNLDQSSS